MTTTTEMGVDRIAMEELSRRFNQVFETLEASEDLFAEEVFFDLNMPVWRFQIAGPAAFVTQLKHLSQGPSRVDVLRTVPTFSGFVTEHVEHQEVDGEDLSARRMWLCEVVHGRITQVICYCSGEWDEALRARHRLEAPMIRP